MHTHSLSVAYHAHKGLPQEEVQEGCQGGEAEQQREEQGHIALGEVAFGACVTKMVIHFMYVPQYNYYYSSILIGDGYT